MPGSDTAIIEWFVGDDCAFAFVVVFRERSPRTIEFTEKQTRVIKQAVAAMEFPGRGVLRGLAKHDHPHHTRRAAR